MITDERNHKLHIPLQFRNKVFYAGMTLIRPKDWYFSRDGKLLDDYGNQLTEKGVVVDQYGREILEYQQHILQKQKKQLEKAEEAVNERKIFGELSVNDYFQNLYNKIDELSTSSNSFYK